MTYGTNQINNILLKLFEKDVTRLHDVKTNLIEENFSLGNPKDGFLFSGQFWSNLPHKQRKNAEKKLLHFDLHPAGREFVDELERTKQEQERLYHGLHLVVRDCQNAQDLRDALPDVVAHTLPDEARSLSRTRDPAWTLQGKPLQLSQYQKTEELLGFYIANGILY